MRVDHGAESRLATVDAQQDRWLQALWGKSDVGGSPHLLVQHLLDTAAVGEVMWDRFLARSLRDRLDAIAGDGGGRRLFAWLCGVHDIGKATPVFQAQAPTLAAAVVEAGLPNRLKRGDDRKNWRHEAAGAAALRDVLTEAWGHDSVAAEWIWPLIAGHHGLFPGLDRVDATAGARRRMNGTDPAWAAARRLLIDVISDAVTGNPVEDLEPVSSPTRGEQLAVAGLIVMADWIASGPHFPAVAGLAGAGMEVARQRADRAWTALGLASGWSDLAASTPRSFHDRFGQSPRPIQSLALDVAAALPEPGLLVVEAPMGEGKTELALSVAESMGRRFGCSGAAIAMPTQATCDPMYIRTQQWLDQLQPGSTLALLHGKRLINRDWREAVRRRGEVIDDRDEFGMPLRYGTCSGLCEDGDDPAVSAHVVAPSDWLLGRYRGLLAPNLVATIDQLLFAATRTKFVALRFAGLAGKVVVIDEVHAADDYMAEFLSELLWWLGSLRCPTILLSATLHSEQRQRLVHAYLAGGGEVGLAVLPAAGYPRITSVVPSPYGVGDEAVSVETCRASAPDRRVSVVPLVGLSDEADQCLVDLIESRTTDGGVVLVIRNTVARAQTLYALLASRFPGETELLHGRFTAADRADKAESILSRIGPPGIGHRPHRLIVVATQIAEQSFDADADLLVTDLAPIDLLLQRVGRLHRHVRPRPSGLEDAAVIVTGLDNGDEGLPHFARGSAAIYGERSLLVSAAIVFDPATRDVGWRVPGDIAVLVERAYGNDDAIPAPWRDRFETATATFDADRAERRGKAQPYRLAERGTTTAPTLAGLHSHGNPYLDVDRHVCVRDSDGDSIEVILIRRDDRGFWSLRGDFLGTNGEAVHADPTAAVGGVVRLRVPRAGIEEAAFVRAIDEANCRPAEWAHHPWLRHAPVLAVEADGSIAVGRWRMGYDDLFGLRDAEVAS